MKRTLPLRELQRNECIKRVVQGFAGELPNAAQMRQPQKLQTASDARSFRSTGGVFRFGSIDANKKQQSEKREQAP